MGFCFYIFLFSIIIWLGHQFSLIKGYERENGKPLVNMPPKPHLKEVFQSVKDSNFSFFSTTRY